MLVFGWLTNSKEEGWTSNGGKLYKIAPEENFQWSNQLVACNLNLVQKYGQPNFFVVNTEPSPKKVIKELPFGNQAVYTDGACPSNGNSTKGGIGVYFGDSRDVGMSFRDAYQQIVGLVSTVNPTNQKCELLAIGVAVIRATSDITIYTDSTYAQKCLCTWIGGWKKNGWVNSKKKPVENQEIIKSIDALIDGSPYKFTIKWVKGHDGIEGNVIADRLAVEGCEK